MKINLIYFILFSSFIFFSLEQNKINKIATNETFNEELKELEDGFYKIKSYDNFSLFTKHPNNQSSEVFFVLKTYNIIENNTVQYYIEDTKTQKILFTNSTNIFFQKDDTNFTNNYLWKLIPKINKDRKLIYYILNVNYERYIEYNSSELNDNYKFKLSDKYNIEQLTKDNEFTFEKSYNSFYDFDKIFFSKHKNISDENSINSIKTSTSSIKKEILDNLQNIKKINNDKNIQNDEDGLIKEIINLLNNSSGIYENELFIIAEKLNKVIQISIDTQKYIAQKKNEERIKVINMMRDIKLLKEKYNHSLSNTYILGITFIIIFFIFLIFEHLNIKNIISSYLGYQKANEGENANNQISVE